jgi:putative SOS response-associated peptidase YedK
MCAEFMIKASSDRIRRELGLPEVGNVVEWEKHLRLYGQAPIVCRQNEEWQIKEMSFSLKPRGTPYPTFNARFLSWDEKKNRIVPFFEKPTWKGPLRAHRCVIPLTGFIEPVYLRKLAGKMVEFSAVSGEILFNAGLYAESVDRETGEVYEGFTMLIHLPSPFVLEAGHHRQPLFLRAEAAREWVKHSVGEPTWALEFLKRNRFEPELKAEVQRSMAKGWEKRIAENEKKHEAELETFKRLG